MKSILEGRPGLSAEVEKIAEVAGYLWQNGWAERNGGNITVNVTEFADDEMKQMPAIRKAVCTSSWLPGSQTLFPASWPITANSGASGTIWPL